MSLVKKFATVGGSTLISRIFGFARETLMATATSRTRIHDDYLQLVKRFPLAHIRGKRHYDEAIEVIDKLAIIDEHKLTPGQSDYLYALSDLVGAYEDKHHRIDLSHLTGLDMLKFLLEQHELNASDLGRLLGNRQLGSAILRGERALSKTHIRKICAHFKVSADLFLM